MWNAIGEALKIFLEKHLIPTTISIVSAIAAYLLLPSDFWMIEKLGKTWFLIFVAGIVFLAVQLLIAGVKNIRQLLYKADLMRENERLAQKKNEEELEKWLSFMDNLSPDDRALIIRLIENENEPEIEHGYVWHSPDSIYGTNLLIKTKGHNGFTLIKLDERAYKNLKAIYDQRGSITHF